MQTADAPRTAWRRGIDGLWVGSPVADQVRMIADIAGIADISDADIAAIAVTRLAVSADIAHLGGSVSRRGGGR